MWNVTLLTKPKCTQCMNAKKTLEEFASEQPLKIKEIDLESHDTLWRRYNLEVPVLFVNGLKAAQDSISINKLRSIRHRMRCGLPPMRQADGPFFLGGFISPI